MKKLMLLFAIFSILGLQVYAQNTVTGKVLDDSGEALPGVTVLVKGTTVTTMTLGDGTYSIEVPDGSKTLVFSYIGMETQEAAITGNVVNVTLKPTSEALGEVVVTALGITRAKKSISYAAQDLSGDDLSAVKTDNVISSLSGKIAGVNIINASGAVGASSSITIRGNSSFGYNQPLFVVDGTPISNGSSAVSQWGGSDFGNAAMDIDPSDIASLSVLKGANATALYGSRGANGVILITTKKGKAQKGVGVTVNSGVTFDNVYLLPDFQNKYGQGYLGSEYAYKKGYQKFWVDQYGIDVGDVSSQMSYSDYIDGTGWASGSWGEFLQSLGYGGGFSYVDGTGNGTWDGMDESWGPRLDIGLNIPQFNSPYTVDDATGDITFKPTPWVSHPDNVKNFFTTGITYDNNVQISGGSDKATARLSLSNRNVKGAVPNTDLNKTSVNLNSSLQLSDKLSVSSMVNYVNNSSNNLPGGGYDENNIMQSLGSWFGRQVDMTSLRDHWDELNAYGNPYNWNSNYHNNPYWTVNKNTTSRDRDRVFGNVRATYKITDWLNIMARVGDDYYTEQRKHVVADKSIEAGPGGNFWQNTRTRNELNADLFLNFDKKVGEDLRFDGLIGGNYRNTSFNYSYLEANALTVPDFYTIGNASGNPTTDMYLSNKVTNSVFGNLNVSYKNFLYVNTSLRNDWSSTLPPDNWSYLYPSVGVSFVFTDAFGLSSDILSFGKLRASWAQVGNDTDPYQLDAVYLSSTDLYNGVTQFYTSRQLPVVGLEPEKITSYEGGLELKFLKNRIGFDITAYDMLSRNQILGVDVAPSSGFTSMKINAGEIETKGIEVVTNFNILNYKNLKWNMTVNWSKYSNMVNSLYGDLESYQFSTSWASVSVEARPGETFGTIMGKGFQRDSQGRILIDPASGQPQATADPIELGSITPDWNGGIRNSFTFFKSITASVLIDASMGGDLFSVTDWFGGYAGILGYTAEGDIRENGLVVGKDVMTDQEAVYGTLVEQFDTDGNSTGFTTQYYDADGNDATAPVVNTDTISAQTFYEGYYGYGAEQSIIDASYIKLREASLTYALPSSVIGKIGFVQGISVSLIGRNLALLYTDKSNRAHIDPETSFGTSLSGRGIEQYQIPATRSLGFKIQVRF